MHSTIQNESVPIHLQIVGVRSDFDAPGEISEFQTFALAPALVLLCLSLTKGKQGCHIARAVILNEVKSLPCLPRHSLGDGRERGEAESNGISHRIIDHAIRIRVMLSSTVRSLGPSR